ATYLDIGCGTGNYTIAMNDSGVQIVGVDFSSAMLAQAREKRPSLRLHQARAESMPFKRGTFAGATCTFVHHHMDDPIAAFAEVRRVLRPGSRLVLLNSTHEQMRHYWMWEYFPKAFAQAAAPFERFETRGALAAAGFEVQTFEPYEVTDDLRDWFLLCGKNRPELYLDPQVEPAFRCSRVLMTRPRSQTASSNCGRISRRAESPRCGANTRGTAATICSWSRFASVASRSDAGHQTAVHDNRLAGDESRRRRHEIEQCTTELLGL